MGPRFIANDLRPPGGRDCPSAAACGRRTAFTLLQLVVVVAVILVALSLLIPALKHQVERARSAKCQDNLRRIQLALYQYRGFNDNWWPERVVRTQAGLTIDSNVWVSLLLEQDNDPAMFTCPADINAPPKWSPTDEFYNRAVAYAPSYGLNQLTWRTHDLAPSDDPGRRYAVSQKIGTKIILLADRGPDLPARELPRSEAARRQVLERYRDAGRLPPDDDFRMGLVKPPGTWLVPRHGRGINLISMSGAVAREHQVDDMIRRPPQRHYDDCFLGNCAFCRAFKVPHYDFSSSDLYFWNGPYQALARPVDDVAAPKGPNSALQGD